MANWIPLEAVPNPLLKNLESVPLDRFRDAEEVFECVNCEDNGWIVVEGRGARKCECLESKQRSRLLDRIPPEYRGFDLGTLQPDVSIHPGQESLITAVRKDPEMSLLLSGRVGSGKSLIGWLLYKRAIEQDRPAVAIPLAELMGQFRRFECGSDRLPAVTSEDLRDSSRRWLLFFDEVDKPRPTEFAAEQLLSVMDAIYTYRHQLILTANVNKDDLRAHWSQASEMFGVSIMRRILELHGMATKEMF